jgi:hypothetical protein
LRRGAKLFGDPDQSATLGKVSNGLFWLQSDPFHDRLLPFDVAPDETGKFLPRRSDRRNPLSGRSVKEPVKKDALAR